MRHILNTLYVNQDNARLHKDGEAIIVRHEKQKIAQFPIVAVGEIVCFGFGISVSPPLAEFCASRGTTISYLNGSGRFLARMEGPIRGNVLLRRKQYRDADSASRATEIARCCVAAKLLNQKNVLLRFLRNHPESPEQGTCTKAINRISRSHRKLSAAKDVDTVRGLEGESSAAYFAVFNSLIRTESPEMRFTSRNRRPPRDRINALLSLGYALLANDMRSSLESIGLDPYVGFLHKERPGRPSLALDIMEEFRAPFVDRLVLTLVNLGKIGPEAFDVGASGEVQLKVPARKEFLAAYQKRKRELLDHPFLEEKLEIGLIFLAQARLLARHIRGDLEIYPAFIWK